MKRTLLFTSLVSLALAVLPALVIAQPCTFTTTSKLKKLDAPCTTDTTILVPNGFFFDGGHHMITVVDPPGGAFEGAVVKTAGASATINNVTLDASGLSAPGDPHCAHGLHYVVGVLFDGAAGETRHHDIVGTRHPCYEFSGIEIRKAPFDGTHPAPVRIKAELSKVTEFTWGMRAVGDVYPHFHENVLTCGVSGIGVTAGAYGDFELNTIGTPDPCPGGLPGLDFGVVVTNTNRPARVTHNLIQDAAKAGVMFLKTTGATMDRNTIMRSTNGMLLQGAKSSNIKGSQIEESDVNGIQLVDAVSNSFKNNIVRRSGDDGVFVYGSSSANVFKRTQSNDNGGPGFSDTTMGAGTAGTANTYLSNTASGNVPAPSAPPGLAK